MAPLGCTVSASGSAVAVNRPRRDALRTDPAILVEGLTKRFGSVMALDGIDFTVPPGTVFGLLGPNGAGKTTAIRILTTILRPDAGRAEILGMDVLRQPGAVWLNFGLADAADRTVRTYSGGMRRRLDVAAALVQRPPVLFLDEPTTGLDLQSRGDLWEMIRQLVADGTTVLLTTQYLEEADRLAERIAVVDRGRIIANDTPAALKAQLGSTVIEIQMDDDATAARAVELLSRSQSSHPEREGATVRLNSNDGARELMDVLRSLDSERFVPTSLAVREPSLDDVFLTLTGAHAEDQASGGGRSGGAR